MKSTLPPGTLSLVDLETLKRLDSLARQPTAASREALARAFSDLSKCQADGLPSAIARSTGLVLATTEELAHVSAPAELMAIIEDDMQLFGPAARAQACVSLMNRSSSCGRLVQDVQRRLSKLLIAHPVLLDPRLLFRGDPACTERAPLAHHIAYSSFASLPRAADGFTEAQLSVFVAHPSVRAGLTRPAPNNSTSGAVLRDKTPVQIATSSDLPPRVPGATRSGFLESMVSLNEIALKGKPPLGRPAPSGLFGKSGSPSERDAFFRLCSRVFWDVVTTQGAGGTVEREDFVSMMRRASPFPVARDSGPGSTSIAAARCPDSLLWNSFRLAAALHFDSGIFAESFELPLVPGFGKIVPSGAPAHEVGSRVHAAVQLLVDLGAVDNACDAAAWLARVSIGSHRVCSGVGLPLCSAAAAEAFVRAVGSYGALCESIERGQAARPGFPEPYVSQWLHVIDSYAAEHCMRETISRQTAGAGDAPVSRTRGLRL